MFFRLTIEARLEGEHILEADISGDYADQNEATEAGNLKLERALYNYTDYTPGEVGCMTFETVSVTMQ